MGIVIRGYSFEGPIRDIERIQSMSGIVVIISYENGEYVPIDIAISSNLKSKILTLKSNDSVKKNICGTLLVSYIYSDDEDYLKQIKNEILREFSFRCHREKDLIEVTK